MKIVSAFLFLTAAEASNNIRGRRKALQLVGYGGEPNANRFPLQLCEGDCDNDAEVRSNFIVFCKSWRTESPFFLGTHVSPHSL